LADLNKFKFKTKNCTTVINTSNQKIKDCGIEFTEEQQNILKSLNIPSNSNNIGFYMHPEIIPPFEFCADTQDCKESLLAVKEFLSPWIST